jgi:predicted alpha/beta hydrolase family esterase
MRAAEADILIVPGLDGSGPDHWQSRWEQKLSSARRVEQDDWSAPRLGPWQERLLESVAAARRPVVLVAHSLGVILVAHTALMLTGGGVRGALLVCPPDVERADTPEAIGHDFAPVPHDPLPFPSLLVASRNDPFCSFERAEDFAYAWGSALVDAGLAGHVNAESGFGPWPEGLMRFAGFMKGL